MMDFATAFAAHKTKDGYTVTAARPGQYSLFTSASPDGFTSDAFVADFNELAELSDPMPGERCYFHVLDDKSCHYVTSLRVLPFQSVENFRELGGYRTEDGRFVRWGRFYRSARLSHLTAKETDEVASLGIRTLLDLRSGGEISRHPDPEFPNAEYRAISAILEMDGNEKDFDPAHLLTQTPEEMKQDEQDFMDIYRAMPFSNRAYEWMFERLLSAQAPILFHCTAGKDRTGIGAALILMALGVPRKLIEEDYMLTNQCCRSNIDSLIGQYYRDGQPEFVKRYLTAIGGVGLYNLEAALDEIENRYGTKEAFLEREYGLGEKKLGMLREMYLEAPHPAKG